MSKPDKEKLRLAIIRAGLELGTELGAEGVTMRGIARRLGISVTSLYQCFANKDAILHAIRLHGIEQLCACLQPVRSHEDPMERLILLAISYIDFARKNPWLYTVLYLSDEIDWTFLSDEERALMFEPQRCWSSCIEEGVRTGLFAEDVEVQTAPFEVWALSHGLASLMLSGRVSRSHAYNPVEDEDSLLEGCVRRLVRGFATRF